MFQIIIIHYQHHRRPHRSFLPVAFSGFALGANAIIPVFKASRKRFGLPVPSSTFDQMFWILLFNYSTKRDHRPTQKFGNQQPENRRARDRWDGSLPWSQPSPQRSTRTRRHQRERLAGATPGDASLNHMFYTFYTMYTYTHTYIYIYIDIMIYLIPMTRVIHVQYTQCMLCITSNCHCLEVVLIYTTQYLYGIYHQHTLPYVIILVLRLTFDCAMATSSKIEHWTHIIWGCLSPGGQKQESWPKQVQSLLNPSKEEQHETPSIIIHIHIQYICVYTYCRCILYWSISTCPFFNTMFRNAPVAKLWTFEVNSWPKR